MRSWHLHELRDVLSRGFLELWPLLGRRLCLGGTRGGAMHVSICILDTLHQLCATLSWLHPTPRRRSSSSSGAWIRGGARDGTHGTPPCGSCETGGWMSQRLPVSWRPCWTGEPASGEHRGQQRDGARIYTEVLGPAVALTGPLSCDP